MINIVGTGLAGMSAAIALAEKGRECNLISYQEAERAQSVMAEGGINASLNTMNENDSIEEHYTDTLKGGSFLADPNAVWGLVNAAPEIVMWLKNLGVPFESKDGKIIERNFGGQKKKRTAYVKSSTGKMLMSALIDEVRKYEVKGLIHRYSHHKVYDLVIEDQKCIGLKVLDRYTGETYQIYGSVLLASGGLAGLFPGMTTGSSDNTGELVFRLFSKGLKLANLEMIQYHPTTIGITGKRMLVSEAARGEGGRFMTYRNNKPYYFMEELYPEEKNLTTRDVATRAVYRIMNDPECSGDVYLDMTHLDKQIWDSKLSDMRDEIKDYLNIDISVEPFKIEPGIHYFMGGICVDEKHHTNIDGLLAAGECCAQYHGANRLGGNSLLGAIYGGKVAADNITDGESGIKKIKEEIKDHEIDEVFSLKIRDILRDGMSIIRNKDKLEKAIYDITVLKKTSLNKAETEKIIIAQAMLECALKRKESRGAHFREDYPETDDEYRKTTVVSYDDGIKIEFADIPERRNS